MQNSNMLFIENAQIIYKNFSGKEGPYNDEGTRTFSVVIDDEELATKLANDGWNIKPMKDRDDPNEIIGYSLPVAVSYRIIPPRIEMFMGTGKDVNRVLLDEKNVSELDYQQIAKADVYIAPSRYTSRVESREKIKAYLRSMAVFVELDPIAAKYGLYENQNYVEE